MRIHGNTHRDRGFTIIEILIVVTIIGALAVMAWPNYVKYRARAQVGTCISNLKQIEGAKAQWAFENLKNNADVPVMSEITPYLKHSETPTCPSGGTYQLRRIAKQVICSEYGTGHLLFDLDPSDDPTVD